MPMSSPQSLESAFARMQRLYLLNFALLFTHQIDSAFWKEWDLFGIPGGIQVFLALNFPLLVIALVGFEKAIRRSPSAVWFSLLLVASGIFAFCIHTFFLLGGHREFWLPASIVVLVLILGVSLAQGSATLAVFRALRASPTSEASSPG